MPERIYKAYLGDILVCCNKITLYITGMSFDDFFSDEKSYDAVLRNLEIIGEAVKHIPSYIRKMNNDIEWRKIAGLRNILIHDYLGIDENVIWDLVQNKIPDLQNKIDRIINL